MAIELIIAPIAIQVDCAEQAVSFRAIIIINFSAWRFMVKYRIERADTIPLIIASLMKMKTWEIINPKEAKRQGKHREMIVDPLERELKKHPDTSASARWTIELLASRRYKRHLRVTKGNKIRIDRTSIKEAARYDGKWVLETDDDTISLEDAALGYKGQPFEGHSPTFFS